MIPGQYGDRLIDSEVLLKSENELASTSNICEHISNPKFPSKRLLNWTSLLDNSSCELWEKRIRDIRG